MKQAGVTHCRHCGEGIETIKYILNQYKKKGFNLYMERHNKALQVVYYNICRHYGFEVPLRWWEMSPVPVTENEQAKVLWGKLWVDQRKKCADISDVAQVTDICTLPN